MTLKEAMFAKWNGIPHVRLAPHHGDCVDDFTMEELQWLMDELKRRIENNGPWHIEG